VGNKVNGLWCHKFLFSGLTFNENGSHYSFLPLVLYSSYGSFGNPDSNYSVLYFVKEVYWRCVQKIYLWGLLLLSESYVVAVFEVDNLLFTPKLMHFCTTYTSSSRSHIYFRAFLTRPTWYITELPGPKAAPVQCFFFVMLYILHVPDGSRNSSPTHVKYLQPDIKNAPCCNWVRLGLHEAQRPQLAAFVYGSLLPQKMRITVTKIWGMVTGKLFVNTQFFLRTGLKVI